MIYKTGTISYDIREYIFWALAALCVALLAIHIYAVFSTTRNVALRQMLEREVAAKTLDQGALELKLVEARNKVDLTLATNYGFQEVREPVFVSRALPSGLSINTINR